MTIHTQESFTGFIASDPQLSHTGKGEARFYTRVGQEHYPACQGELRPVVHSKSASAGRDQERPR